MMKFAPSRVIVIICCFFVSFVSILLLSNGSQFQSQQPIPLPEATKDPVPAEQFLPASFGLPDKIGNVKILAVQVPANTECMGENEIRIVAQTDDQSSEDLMNNAETSAVVEALNAWNREAYIGVLYVNPKMTQDMIITSIQQENFLSQANGCIRLGGPFIYAEEDLHADEE